MQIQGKYSSYELYVAPGYYELSNIERADICNGCGQKDAFISFLIPNHMYGLNVSEACDAHDHAYFVAESTSEAKKSADRSLLYNFQRIIKANTKWKWLMVLRYRRAKKYYYAVKYFGGDAFWNGKN